MAILNKTDWEQGFGRVDDFMNAHVSGWQNINKSYGTIEEVQALAKAEVGENFIVRTEEYRTVFKYRFKRRK